MYSLIQHAIIGILFLAIAHWLLDIFHVKHFSRQMIEILLWSSVIWFIASGLWMPLM